MLKKSCLLFFIVLLSYTIANAQNLCPQNIDFENSNFTNWNNFTGTVTDNGVQNIVSVSSSGPVANRHDITSGAGLDPYGNFSVVSPVGGLHSIKLGNDQAGNQAERVTYKFTISGSNNLYSLLYSYAVVFEDPGHPSYAQPRFTVEAFDSATGLPVKCLPNPFIASSNLPGFSQSSVGFNIWYQPWVTRTLNFSGLAGKTIYLQFTTADCTYGGHFGYAYVDVSCGTFQILNGYCPGSSTATFTAPPGFASYSWRDSTLATVVGTGMSITIPAPANASKYYVILTPDSGYGCIDTLLTIVTPSAPPVAVFSAPDTFCLSSPVQFTDASYSTGTGTFVNQWSWNFGNTASGSSNTSSLQNPTHYFTAAGTYTVSLVVTSNISCVSSTISKSIVIIPSITVNAGNDTSICSGASATLHASVTPSTPSISGTSYSYSWYPTTGLSCTTCKNPIATPTSTTTYYFTTNYYPNGCSRTDSVIVTVIQPLSTVSVTASASDICTPSPVQLNASILPTTCGVATETCGSSAQSTVGNNNGFFSSAPPFIGIYDDARTQMIYRKSELNAAGIIGGIIKDIALYVNYKGSTIPYQNFTIKLGCTTDTALYQWATGLTTVYSNTTGITTTSGWNNFALSTPYNWDKSSNLIVEICFDNASSSYYDYVNASLTNYPSVVNYYDYGTSGCSMTSYYNYIYVRPDIRFNVCTPANAGVNFTWSPTTALSNPNISNPISTTTATITYTVTATAGVCGTSTGTKTITVTNLQANFTSADTICYGSSMAFTNTSTITGGGTITKYNWNFGDMMSGFSDSSSLQNPSHTFSSSGNYVVTLTLTSSTGCTSVKTKTIVVSPLYTVNAGYDVSICNGSSAILSGYIYPTPSSVSYQWSPTTNLSCTNCLNPTANPTATTTYYLSIGSGSCISKDSMTITILPGISNLSVTATPSTVCPGSTSQLNASITPVCGPATSTCVGTTQYTVGNG
ncbi:MAG: hypothetical protein RIQ33_2113, partial [Bacteroidota bacterium]